MDSLGPTRAKKHLLKLTVAQDLMDYLDWQGCSGCVYLMEANESISSDY